MKLPDFLLPKRIVIALALVFTVATVSHAISATYPGSTGQSVDVSTQKHAPQPPIEHIEEKSSVPFETENQDDSTLPVGQTQVSQEGVNGERTKVWEVSYVDGRETSRKVVSDEVTTKPVTKIVKNGTYVAPPQPPCPGYINVDGNFICDPDHDPNGATALCVDGTYSHSQHRRGTCSGHGGVARWINYPY